MPDTLPCWPEWMPKPQRTGYGYEVMDRTLNTDMEISSVSRVEFDTDEKTISCIMILHNRVELEFYEAFDRDCLRHGTRWFQMPIWMTGKIEWYNCRFVTRPKIDRLIGCNYATVSMKLKIERRELLDPDILEVLMIFGPGIERQLIRANAAIAALAGVTNISPGVFI
jgi:hypothetical protein